MRCIRRCSCVKQGCVCQRAPAPSARGVARRPGTKHNHASSSNACVARLCHISNTKRRARHPPARPRTRPFCARLPAPARPQARARPPARPPSGARCLAIARQLAMAVRWPYDCLAMAVLWPCDGLARIGAATRRQSRATYPDLGWTVSVRAIPGRCRGTASGHSDRPMSRRHPRATPRKTTPPRLERTTFTPKVLMLVGGGLGARQ